MNDRPNTPLSEQIYTAGQNYADLLAAAQMLEEGKSAFLSQKMALLQEADTNLSVAKAELRVKASEEWSRYIKNMVSARKRANLAQAEKEYLRCKFSEWMSADANHRAVART